MDICTVNGVAHHVKRQGPETGPQIVFANSLGTDFRLWDQVIDRLPEGFNILRYDKRGHGLSDCPNGPYTMGKLVGDAEAIMEAHGFKEAVFVGLSIGGLIAQGLAAKRLDLIRAMVLSNTAAKIGTRDMWQDRIDTVRAEGIAAISDGILQRWFAPTFYGSTALSPWKRMLESCPVEGYAGCCAAIAGTDFYTTTAALRLPTMVISGDRDGSTPPDLMRELAELIPGSDFQLMRGVGHLPCVEDPDTYAAHLIKFFQSVGHMP